MENDRDNRRYHSYQSGRMYMVILYVYHQWVCQSLMIVPEYAFPNDEVCQILYHRERLPLQ